jgi:putative DNA primase/helicase
MNATNIKKVAGAALSSIERIMSRWLPDGKRHGHEYRVLNPTRADSKLGSFSINLNTGAWADFASDDKGGDLVALVAYLEGVKQGEAAKLLAEFLGMAMEKPDPAKRATSNQKKAGDTTAPPKAEKPQWTTLLPVPDDAPQPYASHPKHGKPSMSWEYRNEDGQLLCLVYRFEPKSEGERKQFFPLTFCRNAAGKREWRWQGLPDPRPLYNLDKLAANASAPVVVCEGEKAADAAALLFPDAVCITMLNGALSPHKTDWQPLAGRTVWLWPDNDEAGRECMAKVSALVRKAEAASVEVFNLSAFACAPGGGEARPMPEKWDAADAVSEGWTAAHVAVLMQSPDILQSVPVDTSAQVTDAPRETVADDSSSKQLSRFDCSDRGVWYYDGGDDKWWWVCSMLKITAFTRDAKNESWGRLLEFDDMDGTHHAWAMPMELLKGDGTEYRGTLLSMGLQIAASGNARNLLTQYIQTSQVEQRARCVERTGWHGNVFVMPDRTIGEDEERILFQSASATPGTFRQKGKLGTWQANVATLCAGNSRLVFAVSAAFAAPLLHVTGMESGGVHLRGDSSTGKTTALRAAASVWGGMEYLQRWRATDNGLEALAAQHSDCLLVLDELSQVDPKAAGEVAYMLANGGGKARANRNGGLRDPASWRILFLSSGEAGLSEHMAEAKKKPKAGQEIRLLDIPSDAGAGLGMFENLHSYANGATFSKALTEAACKHYGTAAQPYITKLVEHHDMVAEWIKKAQRDFAHTHIDDGAGGQVYRAALRFALIGAAGELATKWAITGWQPGEAMQSAVTCYKAWLAQRGGAGNLEELNMLAQVRRFFEAHGEARFTDWDRPVSNTDSHPPRTIQRAGYRKHNTETVADGRGNDIAVMRTEYYALPETFKQEVCAGFDYRVVCKLLLRHGCLMTEGKGYTRKERLPGGEGTAHCFRITHKLFEVGSDE